MDFGACLDSGVVVDNNTSSTATNTNPLFSASSDSHVSDIQSKQKWYGSVGFLKEESDIRDSKIAKTSTATLLRSPFMGSEAQQMLSFSAPYYHPASFSGNSGYGSAGGLSGGNMHGVKGPFTPSQWMELEHQALIYKYITANMPIPPYLLNPIRKAIESAALSTLGLRANSFGWGGFHVGFSNNSDPEPGRCRRTDGKKWRCSRDAVADQKYCERHMNRGRHRSRKPVEPPSATATESKLIPPPAASSASASVVISAGGASNALAFSRHNLMSPPTNPSVSSHLERRFLDKEYVGERYEDHKDRQQYTIPKEQNPYEESSTLKFGLLCSDSLLSKENNNKSQHPLRQFMDNWPKSQSDRAMVSWREINMQQSDSTQLSISIPTNEKLLKLSPEIEATQMRLGVGTVIDNEHIQRQGNWIPISWEGGPLGEVLHGKNSSSPLNLMTQGWNKPATLMNPSLPAL